MLSLFAAVAFVPSVQAGAFIGTPLQAAQTEVRATPLSDTRPAAAAAPDAAVAVEAFLTARGWLDADQIPAAGAANSPHSPAVQAAGVVLRLRGRVVGTGKAIAPTPEVLAAALRQAASTARRDGAVAALGADALQELTLELELGGAPQPLVGATFAEVLAPLHPAAQGLALRHGDTWGYMPAGNVLARGMADPLSRSLMALITEMGIPPRDLPELRSANSTAVYSVASIRLRQNVPTGNPSVLARLTSPMATDPLTAEQARAVAIGIVAHLESDISRRDQSAPDSATYQQALQSLGLSGAYDPLADEARQVAADPADQALCAYALARLANHPAFAPDLRDRARAASRQILEKLAQVQEGEKDPSTAANAAPLMVLALEELASIQPPPPTVPTKSSALIALETSARERTKALLDDSQSASFHMAIAAAAACTHNNHALVERANLDEAFAKAWSSANANSVVTSIPWLLLAERSLGGLPAAMRESPQSTGGSSARTRDVLLRTCIGGLVSTQVALAADPSSPADQWGAYPMRDQGQAHVTAQCARAMHMLAVAMTIDDAVDRPARPAVAHSLRCAARFLGQLQVDASMDYALRSPARAAGGIMTAPFDPVIAPAAQGWALLALVEAQ